MFEKKYVHKLKIFLKYYREVLNYKYLDFYKLHAVLNKKINILSFYNT